MEHIIQFGITIDDDAIQKRIIEQATIKVENTVMDSVLLFTRSTWNKSKLETMFLEEVKNVVQDNKEKIIEESIKYVSQNMMKTKIVKEALADAVKNNA